MAQKLIRGINFPPNVKRYRSGRQDQLRTRLGDFMAARISARRRRTLGGLTPCGCNCKIRIAATDPFILDPVRQMQGRNS